MKRILIGFVLIFLLVSCASAAQPAVEGVPMEYIGKSNPFGSESAEDGAAVFKMYCSNCHGLEGRGDGVSGVTLNPKPSNLVALKDTVGDDYLFWRISTGKPGTAMVAWKGILTDEQIWKVVTFLHTLK